jgi:hypothetical protein
MKVKELIEKLQEYPADMEVVLLDSCDGYEPSIEVEKVTATVYPEDINEKDEIILDFDDIASPKSTGTSDQLTADTVE